MQNGSIIRRNRKRHSDIWQFRWWEKTSEGKEDLQKERNRNSRPDSRPGSCSQSSLPLGARVERKEG